MRMKTFYRSKITPGASSALALSSARLAAKSAKKWLFLIGLACCSITGAMGKGTPAGGGETPYFGKPIDALLSAVADDPPAGRSAIQQEFDRLFQENRITTNFTVEDIAHLPLGIVNAEQPTDQQVIILVSGGRITPQGAVIDAFMQVPFAPTGEMLYFKGTNIPFDQSGIGGQGVARLYLEEIAGGTAEETSQRPFTMHLDSGPTQTFVEWGCTGLRRFKLSGHFSFKEDMLNVDRALEPSYPHPDVRASFAIEGTDFGDLVTEVSLPAFKVNPLDDYSFRIRRATVDLSEVSNPAGVAAHPLYGTTLGQLGPLWTGFYAAEATIILPEFLHTSPQERPEFGIHHLIIDEHGFSGAVALENLLSLKEGQAGGWPLSVESIYLEIFQNQLVGGGMGGHLVLPIGKEADKLGYEAMIYQDENERVAYAFEVSSTKSLQADALLAELQLDPASLIRLHKSDSGVYAEALLHGSMSIEQAGKFKVPNVAFENLHLLSRAPHVRAGYFALVGEQDGAVSSARLGPFAFHLNQLGLGLNRGKYELYADGGVALMGKSGEDNILSGSTGFRIRGSVKEMTAPEGEGGQQQWQRESSQIEKIAIESNIGVLKIKGIARYFGQGNTDYGSGFQGAMSVTLGGERGMQLETSGMFSERNGTKYWYLDALYGPGPDGPGSGGQPQLGPGIIERLAGGFAYNMRPTNRHVLQTVMYHEVAHPNHTLGEEDNEQWKPHPTGLLYEQMDEGGVAAFMDVVMKPGAKTKSVLIQGELAIALNQNFGLRSIEIGGTVHMMPQNADNGPPESAVGGGGLVAYDFENRELHAEFEAAFSGSSISARIYTVLHFGPSDWWVYMGTPDKRMSASIASLGTVEAYLMIGTRLEPFPAPKISLQDDWGNPSSESFTRGGVDQDVGGVAFGAALYKTYGDNFLIFYANLTLSMGFDIAFQDLRGKQCKGRSGEPGIQGWYASGQAWAGVTGAVGMEIKLKFFEQRIEIFTVAAGVVLTADLPNPTWVQGYVYGKFRVLGGLVSGEVSFKMSIGEKCVLQQGAPGMEVSAVKTITPDHGEQDVDVFEVPQVLFEMPIGKSIPVSGESGTQKYRIEFDYLRLRHNNQDIDGEVQWNEAGDLLAFRPTDVLPPEANIRLELKVHWQEYRNGAFVNLMVDGQLAAEEHQVDFTTGKAPDYLPKNNVRFSYPQDGQYNYYREEHPKGYIQLDRPQKYLWQAALDDPDVRLEAWFHATPVGDTLKVPLRVDLNKARLSYDIPTNLSPESAYRMALWRVVKTKALNLDQQVATRQVSVGNDEKVRMQKTDKQLAGRLSQAVSKELYESYFRVSRYTTFARKMQQVPSVDVVISETTEDFYRLLGLKLNLDETFDGYELEAQGETAALLEVNSVPLNRIGSTHWVKGEMIPQLYEHYPPTYGTHQFTIQHRDLQQNGTIPLQRFRNQYYYGEMHHNAAQFVDGTVSTQPLDNIFWYDVSYHAHADYVELKNQMSEVFRTVANENVPAACRKIYLESYKPIKAGQYALEFRYRLPGAEQASSTMVLPIRWEVD